MTDFGCLILQTTKKSMFGGSSKTVSTFPVLYQWLLRYKSLLVAKVTKFYVHYYEKQKICLQKLFFSKQELNEFAEVRQISF